jgi:hypothetical protein
VATGSGTTNKAAAASPADDPALWVLEDVEPLDAPVVWAQGEGFKPTQEDQVKLDEIDASVHQQTHSEYLLTLLSAYHFAAAGPAPIDLHCLTRFVPHLMVAHLQSAQSLPLQRFHAAFGLPPALRAPSSATEEEVNAQEEACCR